MQSVSQLGGNGGFRFLLMDVVLNVPHGKRFRFSLEEPMAFVVANHSALMAKVERSY